MTKKTTNEAEKMSAGGTSKVAAVIDKNDLDRLGDELEARWTGEGRKRKSSRDRADIFNQRLIQAALDEAGASVLEREVAKMYELLTDDDVSSGVKTQTRKRLEREGINVEEFRADFVSHQAVHTYLRKYRNVTRNVEQADQTSKYVQSVNQLENRTMAVTVTNVDRLHQMDRVDIGDFDVLVNVQIFCNDCGSVYEIGDLVEEGGCDCQ